jgi:hypothetical protein
MVDRRKKGMVLVVAFAQQQLIYHGTQSMEIIAHVHNFFCVVLPPLQTVEY